jgi:hypothetical protein
MKDNVPITARISTEAHEILVREAQALVVNEKSRLPIGEILNELVLYIEGTCSWAAIVDRIRCDRECREEHRRFLDCDRKRRQKQ